MDARTHVPQMLDSMELERERGITIKAQAVRVAYRAADGETYHLHLIDTPGHVDFSYEVSRSLAACEGALLVVDAAQGVEAQTVANAYAAIEAGLELIPVLNKVDLPSADPDGVAGEVADLLGGDPATPCGSRRRPGRGCGRCWRRSSTGSRRPTGEAEAPPRALIFDSEFDQYRGVVAFVRMIDGRFAKRRADRRDAGRDPGRDRRHRLLRPRDEARAGDVRGRGRLRDHRDQGRDQAPGRRHPDQPRAPGRRGAARLPRGAADGLLRAVPDRHRPLRGPPRRPRPACPQRRRALVRARDLRRPRLRLSLRLPRPPPHGHRPRAARARVRPRAARHHAQRPLRGEADRR